MYKFVFFKIYQCWSYIDILYNHLILNVHVYLIFKVRNNDTEIIKRTEHTYSEAKATCNMSLKVHILSILVSLLCFQQSKINKK